HPPHPLFPYTTLFLSPAPSGHNSGQGDYLQPGYRVDDRTHTERDQEGGGNLPSDEAKRGVPAPGHAPGGGRGGIGQAGYDAAARSEEHTSELQSRVDL